MMDGTSGGSYFYIDEQNRAVIGTPAGTIEIVEIRQGDGDHGGFEHVTKLDVRDQRSLEHVHDKTTSVMPDGEGRL